MKQIRRAVEAELAKMTARGRRIVVLVTAVAAAIFAAFALFILWALAVGTVRLDAVAITLPIVVVCALWFGFIAVVARVATK